MEKKNKGLSKSFWIILCSICLVFLIILIVGIISVKNKKPDVVKKKSDGGNIVLNYSGNTDGLSISNAIPTSDMVGMKSSDDGTYFDFSIDTTIDSAKYVEYEVSLSKVRSASTINDSDIRVYLEKEKDGTYNKVFGPSKFEGLEDDDSLGTEEGNMVLTKVKKSKTGRDNYRLRIWMADSSLMQNGSYSVEVEVKGKAK